jgi:hypothetical protein
MTDADRARELAEKFVAEALNFTHSRSVSIDIVVALILAGQSAKKGT